MSRPKTYPPYSVEGESDDAKIVDSVGNDVMDFFGASGHYSEAIPDMMQILCDALNSRERKGGA